VLARLGDRVAGWTTLNEPWCSAFLGYASRRARARAALAGRRGRGRAPPAAGARAGDGADPRAGAGDAPAGITLNLFPVAAASLGRRRRRGPPVDGLQNRIFLDPVLRGGVSRRRARDLAPYGLALVVRDGDLTVISAPVDLLGVNYYRALLVAAPALIPGGPGVGRRRGRPVPAGRHPRTASGWEVQPAGLTDLLLRLHREYPRLPLYITENGAAYPDELGPDGTVRDRDRIAFLAGHLRAAHEAIRRASTCAGTSAGRCWTTSSGPRATRSGSAWCTWTSRTQRRTGWAITEGERPLVRGSGPS
jgi:beta-glucosidase